MHATFWWVPHEFLRSSTALVRTRISSLPTVGCVVCFGDKVSGFSLEHAHSSGSEAIYDMVTASSSDLPKEINPLAAYEGRWSSHVKHTGKPRHCGESEACGSCTGMNSLKPSVWALLLRCYFLLGERGNGRGERGGPPSFKKVLHEQSRARLMLSLSSELTYIVVGSTPFERVEAPLVNKSGFSIGVTWVFPEL